MHKKVLVGLASLCVVTFATRTASAQSAYFEAVTNLNPAIYYPLQETTQPPIGDVENNLGSLGPVGNAIYSGANANKGYGGATADGDASVFCTDGQGSFLAVPTTDPRTAVQSGAFTVECWVNSAEQGRNFEGILSKSGGNNAGINHANNQAGWCLSQNYIAYLDTANFRGWDFHVFNGIGHEGAEVMVPYNVQNGVWYHLVATFDGTNCVMYVDGTNMVAAGDGIQIPMTGSYVPDTWNQLCIGTSRNLNGNNYHGAIDEVAIYTNVLTPTQIQNHYAAASSASPYSAAILTDSPYMYWRMDSPAYTAPDPSTYPVAAGYGTYASSFGAIYGTASQPGVPGPQFAGMLDPNNANSSYGVAINGICGNNGATANVPIGYDNNGVPQFAADAAPVIVTNLYGDPNAPIVNPTNHTPMTMALWFKGNPDDWARFKCIVGHSDSGWRLAMNQSGQLQFNPGPGGEAHTAFSYDDGTWHQAVCTYDGTNVLTYVDGRLDATSSTMSVNLGSPTFPILGGAPDYLNSGNNYTMGTATGTSARNGYNQRTFSGSIAHFALFTNALTAAQVQSLYNAAVPNQAPYILGEPVTGRVNPQPTDYLYFGVVANGTGPLSYQWYFNTSSNYAGATKLVDDGIKYTNSTTSQLTISNLVATDSGYYFAIITNNYGSVTTILASLSVNYAPVITAQNPTTSISLFSGQQATLSVTATAATNALPLVYQWYVNGVADPNGTNAVYISPPATTTGTSFSCIVSDAFGSATNLPVSIASITPLPAALTNAPYSSNILALKPTAYWPMHETGESAATTGDIEVNHGSLGSIANGIYGDWKAITLASEGVPIGNNENAPMNVYVLHDIRGAIAGDTDPAVHFTGGNGGQNVAWAEVPRTDSASTTIKPPFTLEAWVRPDNNPSFMIILGQDSGNRSGTGNRGGFDWLYSGGTPNCFSMTVYNGNGGGSTEPKTTASYPPGQWYHVVTTFDGTNVVYYINGVQDPLINSSAATMNPNTWDPITIGCGRGYGNNMWQGSIDEVAVYPSILPLTEIQKHYNDGTNAAYANYEGDVLADNPTLYYRMDSSTYTPPALSTWPVLTNYGSVAINGVYTPSATPANVAGPSEQGIPVAGLSANTALAQDGYSMFADAGNIPSFHPSGQRPFSVAAWMKGYPSDNGQRGWQSMVANGDSSWRLNLDAGNTTGNGRANFNAGPGGGSDIGNNAGFQINDGQWHYVVGTFDGTNSSVYVDGLLSTSVSNGAANISSQNIDVFLGGYPQNNNMNWYSNTVTAVANETGRVLAGSMCEAAYWDGVALTPSQIAAVYDSVQAPPVIEVQPISAAVDGNSPFTNSVIASGSTPLSYQWYVNGSPMAGQTSSKLAFNPVQPINQSTDYFVVVANNYGSATSAVVSLTVNTNVSITQDISQTNFTLFAGGHAAFKVAATGTRPFGFTWYENGIVIANATNASYTFSNAQPPNSTNFFYCVVTNLYNSVTSSVATVTILSDPTASYPLAIMADNPVGFWRLNEPDNGAGNNGVVAHDYWAGNDGIYTNAVLGQPGYNSLDTNGASAEFGVSALLDSDVYGIPQSVDFSSPTNTSTAFSIEAWVKGYQQTVDAGIVSKGYGGGGEQFNLDCGSDATSAANPYSHSFRFFVRDALGNVVGVNSDINPQDGFWHHLVGVVDEPNGSVSLYVDGLLVGTNRIASGAGILSSTRSMLIGSRPSNSTTNDNDSQFVGWIQDVAVYNYALTSLQVSNHFNAADIPAYVVQQPTNTTAGEFGTATFTVQGNGTAPLTYQWYDNGSPISSSANPTATTATLVLTNVQTSDNGSSFTVTVGNGFGSATSQAATLTVISGLPQISSDVQPLYFVLDGGTLSIPVTAYGTMPVSYQWQVSDTNGLSWTNLADGGRISGSQSNVLVISDAAASIAGDYQVIITNSYGSVTSSIGTVVVGGLPIGFNGNGVGWSTNQGGTYDTPFVTNGVLTLTESAYGSETRSFFFNSPQYIGAFHASYTYQDVGGGGADGMSFCLQNDARGTAALGGGGGSLGVSGIVPSWELEFNVYSGHVQGYAVTTNGNNGTYNAWSSIPSGDPIDVTLDYANNQMNMTFLDTVTSALFKTNFSVDMPGAVGGQTAYVGFTGADGGVASTQIITNFTFVSIPTQLIMQSGNNVVISWPSSISGYVLQANTNLATPNWVDVTNLPQTIVNGMREVVIPASGRNEFYRLSVHP